MSVPAGGALGAARRNPPGARRSHLWIPEILGFRVPGLMTKIQGIRVYGGRIGLWSGGMGRKCWAKVLGWYWLGFVFAFVGGLFGAPP